MFWVFRERPEEVKTWQLSNLLQDMSADESIKWLEEIQCGRKATPCPDQLAEALKELKEITQSQKATQ